MNTKLSQQFQKAFVLLSLILCFAVNARSQTDTEFWFAAPDVSNGGGNFDIPIAIRMATGSSAATVTISQPANSLFAPIVVSIAANSNTSVDLSTYLSSVENSPANTVNNKGLLISSTTPISAYYEVVSGFCNCNPEIFALKGTNGLGTKFYTPFQTYLNNSTAYNPTPKASFEIVATEDNTTVTITPTQNLVGGRTAGVPFIITMQKGQSYSGVADGTSAASHPTGTLIESNKPIAVSIKDDLLDGAPYGGCADLMGDQLVPVNKLGTEYVILKGQLNFGTEKAFVVATENGTTLTVNGVNVATLNAGGNYTVTFSTASVAVSASKPIYLLHMSGFGCEVGGALLPSTTCSGSDQINVVRSTNEGFFLNLLVRNGAQNNFLFNGNAGVINGASFSVVPNTSNQWVSAQISLSTSQLAVGGSARISNTTDLFQLGVIHGGAGSGTRYGYFSNFSTANVIASSNSPINAGSALNLSATAGFTSYAWTGPNGFTATSATPTISNALPINAGSYNVTVTNNIGCIGTSSTNVTVNTVPATALNFDGSNDFVQGPAGASTPQLDFGTSTDFTFEASVKLNGNQPNFAGIVVKGSGVNANNFVQMFIVNNRLAAEFMAGNVGTQFLGFGNGLLTTTNLNDGNWHHVAMTVSRSATTINLYVDGNLEATVNSPVIGLNVTTLDNAPLLIGADRNKVQYFNGSIDEVRIWRRVLCQGELLQNKGCELSGTQSALAAYYKLNAGFLNINNTGVTTATDGSSNGYNASLNNFGLTGATSNWLAGTVTGTCAAFVPPTATITPAGATTFCAGGTVVLNANTGSGLTYQWQLNGNNISGATNASYTANAAGSYTVVVSQNGCTATSAAAVISILQGPVASITAPASTILCAGSAIVLNANTGSGLSYQWQLNGNNITGATNSNYIANAAGTYTVVVSQNGCTATSSAVTIVSDAIPPVAACKNVNLTLNASGTASIVIPATTQSLLFEDWTGDNLSYYSVSNPSWPNNTLNWNLLSGDIDRANFISGITGSEIDLSGFQNGVIESKQTFNFTPGSYTFSFQQIANSLGGNGVQVDIGTLLNQTFITSLSITSESATFTVTSNTSAKVKLTQVGPSDALGSFIGQIRLVRNVASTLAIENGSTDNCSIASITASKTNFDCSNIGANTVTLTVTDVNGNVGTCQSTVTVIDDILPVIASCPTNITLNATSAAGAVVTYATPTATDICGATVTLTGGLASGSTFPLGTTTVTHTATDPSGNTSTCSFTVTVVGIAPVVVSPGTINVNTTAGLCSGVATYTATETTGIPASTITYSIAPGSTFAVGTTQVTATATNAVGSSSVTFNVVVTDNQAPDAVAQNISVVLGVNGTVTITPSQIDNGSNDECGIANLSLSQTTFNCSNVGVNTVILTVRDNNNNVSTATATVTVAPNPSLTASITAPASTILCAGSAIVLNANTGPGLSYQWQLNGNNITGATNSNYIANAAGTYTVVVSQNGCAATSSAVTIVSDAIPPVAACKNVNLTLNASGTATILVPATTQSLFFEDWTGDNAPYYSTTNSNFANNTLNWNLLSGDIDRANFVSGIAGSEIDLSGFANGVIETKQTFNFTPGSYTFSFQQIANSLGGNGVQVDIGNLLNQTFITSLSITSESATFTVTSNVSAKIKLTQVGPSDALGSFIGQIRLVRNVASTLAIENGSTDNCSIASITASKTNFDCSNIGANTVTLTVTDVNGNVGTCQSTVTVIDDILPVIASCPTNITLNATSAAGAVVTYATPTATDICGATVTLTGGLASGSTFPLGTTTVTHTATDPSGNTSTCSFTVTVVGVAPVVVSPGTINVNTTAGLCSGIATYTATETTGIPASTITYSIAPGSIFAVGTTQVTATATNAVGSSSVTFDVVVADNEVPVAVAQNVTVQLNVSGVGSTTAAAVNNGSSDACGVASLTLSKVDFDCSNVGANTVTLTVTDVNGNVSTADAVVTVVDAVAPVAIAQNVTVQLNASGVGSTTATAVNNGSSDACGVASLALSKVDFDCSNVGANTVTLTVTDVNGNTSTADAVVTVVDAVAPVAVAQNVTVQLNASGVGSTTAAAVNNGSNDACGVASLALSKLDFDCSNVGANTVTLTVTDVNGNTSTADAVVTVVDAVAPVAVAQNVTVQLNASGVGSTTAAAVNNGSNDACGVASLTLSKLDFDCSNVGANTVTLTVTDVNGNTSTADAVVTVVDAVAPVAVAQNVTVQLSASGVGSTTAAAVNNGSSDACGVASLTLSKLDFDCSNVGANTVTLTVTDVNGNTSTADAVVTVVDAVAPVAIAQNVTVQLNASGIGSTTATAVNNGSSDACGVASLALSKVDFDCSNVGANTVTLTVTDVNGNTSTADAVVTVVDAVAPVAVAQNVTVQLSASGVGSTTAAAVNNGSSDACGVASLALSKVDFDCSNVGANTVTLTVTDVNGNTSTADAVVTVVDTVSPVAIAQNISVTLVNGTVMVSGEQVDNGSSDACGIVSRTVVPNMFNCSNIGPNPVLLTVSDANGNSSKIQAVVNVIGAIPTVSISEGVQPVFTQGGAIVLTASSPTATSYLWTGGPATASYFVYASGTYTVRATNEFGCFVDGSRTVTYNANSLLSSYVILAKEEVELEDNVVVASGGVGVTSSCGEIEVKGNSTITNSTTFARARYITVSSNSSVTSRTSTAVPSSLRPTFSFNPYCNTSSSSSCGSRGSSSSTVTSRNINVAQNASVVITDSVIGNVVIGKNATVTFSAPRIYMREMFINDDASVIFSECATIRICNKLDIKKNVDFNTTNSKLLIIYVEDKFTVSEGSNINARVYTLDEMKVKGKSSAPVTMTGMFIAEEVKAEKYVTFNWNTNTTCNTVISKTEVEAVEDGLITNYFDVEVYPNPSVDAFNLRLLSSSDMPFSVTIYDMNGKLIETINVDQSTLSSKLGAGYAEGMYIMLVNQGDQNKTLRLVKSRR